MSEHHESRRGVDPLIVETHGLVKEMAQLLKNHIERDEEVQGRHLAMLESTADKLAPVVEFHKSAQTVGDGIKWALKYMSIPVLSGLGLGAWAWFKMVLSPSGIPR